MKKYCWLIVLVSALILPVKGRAQSDEYYRLTREREELIKEYNYLNEQNSNFWGKKSKKDLMRIIDNLKGIIKKDTEIINTVQASYLKRNADLTVKTEKLQTERKADTRVISDNIHEMKRQLSNLESRDKSRLQRIALLEDQLQEARDKKYEHDRITVLSSLLALTFLSYIIYQKTRKKPKKNVRRS
ncbi:MAG TPA: hypothetical protein VK927_00185 [Adhaeribacter sp.]|nr:hypothetical protein [Adhaeribacter sp.]